MIRRQARPPAQISHGIHVECPHGCADPIAHSASPRAIRARAIVTVCDRLEIRSETKSTVKLSSRRPVLGRVSSVSVMKANSWLDLFVVRSNSLRVHFPLLLVAVPRNDRADQRLSYSPLAARRRASAVSRATSKGARSFRIISVSHICILIEANVSPRYSRLTGLFSRHACVRSRAPLPPSFSGRNYPRGNYPRDSVREPLHRPSMIFMSRIMGGANPTSLSEAREVDRFDRSYFRAFD
jgi:hypothetical protein